MRPDSGGGAGMAPFDRHGADAGGIESQASRLAELANKAIDLRSVTDSTFRPAEAAWDGICAPELRAAPEPVRRSAQQTSGALAWSAVPLRYWAGQVSAFNAEVDRITTHLDVQSRNHYGVEGPDGTRPDPADVASARAEAERQARTQWWTAYDTHVVQGASDAAGMLRDGPTEDNVAKARDVGALPSSPGAFTVFPVLWHQANMQTLANRAAEISKKIAEDPTYRPTADELRLLDDYLKTYGTDETFAYTYLTALGPDDLLSLTGKLALLQVDEPVQGPTIGQDLATIVGSIQAGLGLTLGTATLRRGETPYPGASYIPGRWELSSDWLGGLLTAGHQKMFVGIPYDTDGGGSVEVYGYQLLGVLLSSPDAHFDSPFLNLVGSDMLDFERSHSSVQGAGVPIWYDTYPHGPGLEGFARLNWINGSSAAAPGGFDPMNGLMTALDHNPDAARTFFTSEVLLSSDGPEGGRLSRLDYLLTDRMWIPDTVPDVDRSGPAPHVPSGLDLLGDVLDKAATDHPDERSTRIVESLFYELNVDEGVRSGEFAGTDIVPPMVRDSVAHIAADWIASVHGALDGGTSIPEDPHTHDRDPYTPGVQTLVAHLNENDVMRVLADLGKDDGARQTVWRAETGYAALAYDNYLHGGVDATSVSTLTPISDGASKAFASLKFGEATANHEHLSAEDAAYNTNRDAMFKVGGFAVDQVVGAVAELAIKQVPIAGDLLGMVIDGALDAANEAGQHDSTGQANYDAGTIQASGRATVEGLVNAAIYRNIPADQLPAEFKDSAGQPVAMSQWTGDHAQLWSSWESYLANDPTGRQAAAARTEAGTQFATEYASAVNRLNQWH